MDPSNFELKKKRKLKPYAKVGMNFINQKFAPRDMPIEGKPSVSDSHSEDSLSSDDETDEIPINCPELDR